MTSETFKSRWESYLADINRPGITIAAVFMATIYPFFFILDYYTQPHTILGRLLAIRLFILVYGLIGLIGPHTSGFRKWWKWYVRGIPVLSSAGIAYMMALNQGFDSPYFMGILLVILGYSILLVMPTLDNIVINTVIMLDFILSNAAYIPQTPLTHILVPAFFIFFALVMVSVGEVHNYRQAYKLFKQRYALEQVQADLERTNQQLQEMDKAKTHFFSNITHEFKTPLSLILLPLDIMANDKAVADKYGYQLDVIRKNGLKLLKLVNSILDLIKLDQTRLKLHCRVFDLGKLIGDIVNDIRDMARIKSIQLESRISPGDYRVTGDPDMLERMLVNLLSNALKFTPAHGRIDVLLSRKGDEVQITVSDTGIGIPADKVNRIFDRFYQVDGDLTRRHGGTGIGLSLVKEIVTLHQGHINVHSKVGEGTSFHIVFPVGGQVETTQQSEQDRDELLPDVYKDREYRYIEIRDAIERRVVQRAALNSGPRVLIVDDNPDIIRLVALILGKDFVVISATHPRKGLELAKKFHPDLVITDLMMPDMSGFEFVEQLRKMPGMDMIPVVMLTAKSEVATKVEGHEHGVDYFLEKPFSVDELLAIINNLLHKTEHQVDALMDNSLESLATIAGGLAHEINNPLNYIKTAVEQIREDLAGDGEQDVQRSIRLAELALSGVKRITTVVDVLKSYALAGISTKPVAYNLFDAVRATVALVKPAIGKQCDVQLRLSGQAVIRCRPEEIKLLLSNLIQNAIEAVEPGGRVWIYGTVEDKYVRLEVGDDGPAIPAEVQKNLFQPFFSTKGPGKGMGLGLTVVRRVSARLGAHIEVRSPIEEDKGTAFVLRIPK